MSDDWWPSAQTVLLPDGDSLIAGSTRLVALVEGSRLQAGALGTLLGSLSPEISVVSVSRDYAACRRDLTQEHPDLVVFDVRTVRPELVTTLRAIRVAGPQLRTVVILGSLDPPGIRELLALGPGALLTGDLGPAELLDTIRVVRSGRMVVDPAALQRLMDPAGPSTPALSGSELRILRLAAEGLSNEEIARRLAISLSTLKRNLRVITGKVSARDRTSAVVAAVRAGLI